jgi:chorismate dehydratase
MRPRIAASSYLNSAPLIWSFTNGNRIAEVEYIDAVPSRCAELLNGGEVEAALVPVIEYQRLSNVQIVPDVCVGSKREVRSVVLASTKDNLEDICTIALDNSSRTSAALLKVIFREFVKGEPEWKPSAPDLRAMLANNDAALIIGDPGMTFPRAGLHVFDMAALWRQFTNLGFVFAMWMIRDDASSDTRAIDFKSACVEGLESREEIIDFYQHRLSLPRAELFTYLHDNISFELDDEMEAGLELYYGLAAKHGLIGSVKDLNWLASTAE